MSAPTVSSLLEQFEDVRLENHPQYGVYGTQHLGYRDLPNGKTLVLWPMTFGKVRLVIGPTNEGWVDDGWCYDVPFLLPAVLSLATWDGIGDPIDGWHRNISTARRRTNGDPNQEYVAP